MVSVGVINEYIKWASKVNKLGSPDNWDEKEFGNDSNTDDWDFFDTLIDAKYVNNLIKNDGSLIQEELENNSEREEEIAGLTVIYTNEIEKYFAREIANNQSNYNKYVDKKIKVVIDKDITSDKFEVQNTSDTVIVNMGILSGAYKNINKLLFVSEKREVREKLFQKDIEILNNYFKDTSSFTLNIANYLQIIKQLIINGLDKYEDSIIDDLASNPKKSSSMSKSELIEFTLKFFRDIDKTNTLYNLLVSAIEHGDLLIIYNDDDRKIIKDKYNISVDNGSQVNYNCGKIFIDAKGNTNDFITLVHELMHYNSFKNNDKVGSDYESFFSEFPSIYFEYMARDYAKKNGKESDMFLTRSKNSINNLRVELFNIDVLLSSINGGMDYDKLSNLMDKYNVSVDEVKMLFINNIDNLSLTPYLVGMILSKHLISKNIDSNIILDISTQLYNCSVEEIFEKLGIDISLFKGEINDTKRYK